jgi:hypothetical protein
MLSITVLINISLTLVLSCFPFVYLGVAYSVPLWLNELDFTTKEHKGCLKGSRRLFNQI